MNFLSVISSDILAFSFDGLSSPSIDLKFRKGAQKGDHTNNPACGSTHAVASRGARARWSARPDAPVAPPFKGSGWTYGSQPPQVK